MCNKISVLEEALDLLKDKMLEQHRLSRIWFHYAIEALEHYIDTQKLAYYDDYHYDVDDSAYDRRREEQLVSDYC